MVSHKLAIPLPTEFWFPFFCVTERQFLLFSFFFLRPAPMGDGVRAGRSDWSAPTSESNGGASIKERVADFDFDFDSIRAGKMIKASPPLLLLLLLLFCLGVATPAAGAVRMAPVFNPVLWELHFIFWFRKKKSPFLLDVVVFSDEPFLFFFFFWISNTRNRNLLVETR